jgi:SAM-dependent methyltransferase
VTDGDVGTGQAVPEGEVAADNAVPEGEAATAEAAPERAATWDELAPWWKEKFTHGADLEYELQILPLATVHLDGARRVLDLGTGEGQLARRLMGDGNAHALVVGIDPSAGQLANAAAEGGGPAFVRGRGEVLPFKPASFDAVVCCLVIEHADDADAVLAGVGRVLRRGGRFLLMINHPVVQGPDSGLVDDTILGERYWRIGPYLPESVNVEQVDYGVHVSFAHRPLSRYINPAGDAGMVLVRLEEPAPPLEFLGESVDAALEATMPRLCVMLFERR